MRLACGIVPNLQAGDGLATMLLQLDGDVAAGHCFCLGWSALLPGSVKINSEQLVSMLTSQASLDMASSILHRFSTIVLD